MCTKKKRGPLRLMRLASISRAQLASVRRTARDLEFRLLRCGPTLKLDLGVGWSVVEFPVSQQEMSAIAQLLRIPLHLNLEWAMDVDWEEMQRVEEFLYGLTVEPCHESPGKAAFLNRVLPRLQELKCPPYLSKRLPPLDLEKLAFSYGRTTSFVLASLIFCGFLGVDYESLSRHRIHRLDVDRWAFGSQFPPNRILSPTIKSLGLVTAFSQYEWTPDCAAIQAFCQRFPALEELHVINHISNVTDDFVGYFSELWSEKCLELRERLNVPGLKRIFVTTSLKFSYSSADFNFDWMRKVRAKEPFDRATFWTDPVSEHERMSLVVRFDWPDGPKPAIFRIESDCYLYPEHKKEEPPDSSEDEAAAAENPPDRFDHFKEFKPVLFPD
ncbi:hypothetical protein M3Y99_00818800 [Aphelenchoides fujianensis]|nr:hypothetical protein M3Y99_00818800 [Aphelenchoides fujianensis]